MPQTTTTQDNLNLNYLRVIEPKNFEEFCELYRDSSKEEVLKMFWNFQQSRKPLVLSPQITYSNFRNSKVTSLEYNLKIGNNFREIRRRIGLTLKKTSLDLKCSLDIVARFERGEGTIFKYKFAKDYFFCLQKYPGFPKGLTFNEIIDDSVIF